MTNEEILRNVFRYVELSPNQKKIIETLIFKGEMTPKQIEKATGIHRSHVHTQLSELRRRKLVRVVKEGEARGQIHSVDCERLLITCKDKVTELEQTLWDIQQTQRLLQQFVEKTGFLKAPIPEHLKGTEKVHEKIVQLFKQCKRLIVSTRTPFLWNGKYHGHKTFDPFPGTNDFWDAQIDFLKRSIKNKELELTYVVDVEEYIKVINKKPEFDRIHDIEAMIECCDGIERGWNLSFVERPSKGPRFTPMAFVVSEDNGYFVMSITDNDNVVVDAIFFQHQALADVLASHQALRGDRRNAKEILVGMINVVIRRAALTDDEEARLKKRVS